MQEQSSLKIGSKCYSKWEFIIVLILSTKFLHLNNYFFFTRIDAKVNELKEEYWVTLLHLLTLFFQKKKNNIKKRVKFKETP